MEAGTVAPHLRRPSAEFVARPKADTAVPARLTSRPTLSPAPAGEGERVTPTRGPSGVASPARGRPPSTRGRDRQRARSPGSARSVDLGPVPALCTATGPGLEAVTAGAPAHFLVHLNDSSGGPVRAWPGASVRVLFRGPSQPDVTLASADASEPAAAVRVTFMTPISGTFHVHVFVRGEPIPASPFKVAVQPALADPAHSWVVTSGPIRGVAGTSVAFVVRAAGADGRRKTAGGDRFSAVLQPARGPAASAWQADDDEPATAGAISWTDLRNGDHEGRFSLTTAGMYDLLVFVDGGRTGSVRPPLRRPLSKGPWRVDIVPGPAVPQRTRLAWPAGSAPLVAGEVGRLAIVCEDAFGNLCQPGRALGMAAATPRPPPNPPVIASASARGSARVPGVEVFLKPTHTQGLRDGARMDGAWAETALVETKGAAHVWDLSLCLTKAGTYNVALRAGGASAVPSTLSVVPGEASAEKSTLEVVPQAGGAVAGQAVRLVVQARDRFSNALSKGGSTVAVTVVEGASVHTAFVSPPVDEGDGTYACEMMSHRAGQFTVHARLDGEALATGPRVVNVRPVPGPAARVRALSPAGARARATAGSPVHLVVGTEDAFGNALRVYVRRAHIVSLCFLVLLVCTAVSVIAMDEVALWERRALVALFIVAWLSPICTASSALVHRLASSADRETSPLLEEAPEAAASPTAKSHGGHAAPHAGEGDGPGPNGNVDELQPLRPAHRSKTILEAVCLRECWLLLFIIACIFGSGFMITTNLGQILDARGLSHLTATAITLFSVGSSVGRLAGGLVTDLTFCGRRVCSVACLAADSGLMVVAHMTVAREAPAAVLSGIAIAGVAFGTAWPHLVLAIADLFGPDHLGAIYALLDGVCSASGSIVLAKLIPERVYAAHVREVVRAGPPVNSTAAKSAVATSLHMASTCYGLECFADAHLAAARANMLAMLAGIVLTGLYVRHLRRHVVRAI